MQTTRECRVNSPSIIIKSQHHKRLVITQTRSLSRSRSVSAYCEAKEYCLTAGIELKNAMSTRWIVDQALRRVCRPLQVNLCRRNDTYAKTIISYDRGFASNANCRLFDSRWIMERLGDLCLPSHRTLDSCRMSDDASSHCLVVSSGRHPTTIEMLQFYCSDEVFY